MRGIGTYLKKNLCKLFSVLIKRMQVLFKDYAWFLRIIYYLNTHHRLDLKNPATFAEKPK